MRMHVRIDGREFAVELERRNGAWRVQLEGRELPLDIAAIEPGVWSLIGDGSSACFRVLPASAGAWRLRAHGQKWLAEIQDPRRQPHAESHPSGRLRLTSPMFGRVLRLLAKPGETVAAGAELMIIEAMKMQNPVRCPREGVLMALAVEAGSVVAAGDLLAEIE